MTPLAEALVRRIAATGPITVADFMAACLADPEHGYYRRRDPLGRAGDFVTAPEVSQIFGELIGIWCLSVWLEMGAPKRFILAELGPGRGTLMADALRAAAIRPAFAEAATVAFVEINPDLRRAQASALRGLAEPLWFDRAEDLPDGPLIVVGNEFFDALPIQQYVLTERGWAERMVGLDSNGKLAFGLGPIVASRPPSLPLFQKEKAEVGALFETRPAAEAIVAHLAGRIARDGGAALFIDYGHAESGFGDTLQAVRAHKYDDPLAHPGEADLTAHVDFAALARAAAQAGAKASPVIDQAMLLARLGIAARAENLARGKDAATQTAVAAAVARLAGPDQMGRLFKALALSSPRLALPAFDL